jgi:hypothetical protein
MDYPARKSKKKAPDERSEGRPELKLAEYTAPFGEEWPWRTATEEPELARDVGEFRRERGRLH